MGKGLVSLIQAISAKLATVSPVVLDKIRQTLNISQGGDVLGKIRDYIATNPVSAATVASILASQAPDLISDMMMSESQEVRESLLSIFPSINRYAPNAQSVMGNHEKGIEGIEIDDLSNNVSYVKLAIDRVEFIAGVLGINPKRVGAFVAAVQALEPEDQKIYNMIKG